MSPYDTNVSLHVGRALRKRRIDAEIQKKLDRLRGKGSPYDLGYVAKVNAVFREKRRRYREAGLRR